MTDSQSPSLASLSQSREYDSRSRLAAFTKLTTDGALLTKTISLVQGKLKKVACAQPRSAHALTCEVAGLADFAAVLDSLQSTQAVVYGVMSGRTEAHVVTEAQRGKHPNAIARTRQFFQFAAQPGVMMFDHDGMQEGRSIDPDDLYALLVAAVPPLANVRMLWRPSVSSGILGPDGAPLTGVVGQRFYLLVEDASLIPQAGEAVSDLLWAAGHGWIGIGKAGQKLQKSPVDKSVWQPERLDFAAPPVLKAPLTRTATTWRIFGQGAERLDLSPIIHLADGSVERAADKSRRAALHGAENASAKVRREWVDREAPKLAKKRGIAEDAARDVLARASSSGTLLGSFELLAEDGACVTVADLLSDRDRWHGTRFADPLEPDYQGDHRVAWANLKSGGPPYIFSHAHGGCRYRLARELRTIAVRKGERPRIVDECLDAMRSAGEVFELGDSHSLVHIQRGRLVTVSPAWMLDNLQRLARFEVTKATKQGPVTESVDLREDIPKVILAKGSERMLPSLTAVITAPTLRTDGSLLTETGHDGASGLLLLRDDPDAVVPVPVNPTPEDAVRALVGLWQPFRLFPFVGPEDRAVHVAALLTACVRPSLPTAPGFAYDSPAAGTGKTLLAKCVGALALGTPPPIMPPLSQKDDDEFRKRLFALLRDGHRVIILDNVDEPMGGSALNAFLTAPTFSDRVLGVSEMRTLPNRALFLPTGNNIRIFGDACRRILKSRIDANQERPHSRAFPFCPLHFTLTNRQRMVADALTIMRARICAGRPRPIEGSVASFEGWDEHVRQTVVWLAELVRQRPEAGAPILDDPMKCVDAAFAMDVDTGRLQALLAAWHGIVGSERVTLQDLSKHATRNASLRECMMDIAGRRGALDLQALGAWLRKYIDRRVGGMSLRQGAKNGGRATWQVVAATTPEQRVFGEDGQSGETRWT